MRKKCSKKFLCRKNMQATARGKNVVFLRFKLEEPVNLNASSKGQEVAVGQAVKISF